MIVRKNNLAFLADQVLHFIPQPQFFEALITIEKMLAEPFRFFFGKLFGQKIFYEPPSEKSGHRFV